MGGPVEEVRVAEGNMGRAFSDLLPDVFHHHVYRDDAELSPVHRDHGAVPAQVLAAPAAFGKPRYPGRSVGQHQVGVAGELRQAAAVRHLEHDPAEIDDRLALVDLRSGRRSIGPESLAKGNQRGLKLSAQYSSHAQSAKQRLHRDARGGVHAHIYGHDARTLQDFRFDLLQRKIEAGHCKALALEPGNRLRQGERLPPQLIGVDEDDLKWVSYFDFGRCSKGAGPGSRLAPACSRRSRYSRHSVSRFLPSQYR